MVTSLFSAKAETEQVISSNSQKMALLEAPANVDVNAGAKGGTISVSGDALVSEMGPEGSEADSATKLEAINNEITTYKVKSGDTISGIADKYNVSTNTILWANNLSRTSKISIGQTLVILPVSGVQHKVASGDTLASIAKKYKGSADEIMAYNNVTEKELKIGDIVVVPDGELVPSSSPKASTIASTPSRVVSSALGVGVASAKSVAGYFTRPIKGGTKTQGIHGTNGVDLADSCGTSLYAAAAGVVTVSANGGYNGGYGKYVVISHSNGSQTLYAHLLSADVAEGTSVNQGDVIGKLGNTGRVYGATGCHVHFEIRNGGRNPF